jgi:glycosyltransferase involved in cell wall biosynthesis
MILLSHPTGNSNVRNALLAFKNAGLLKEFWTCVAWDGKSWMNKLLPAGLKNQLRRRAFDESILRVTRTRPLREAGRLLSSALRIKSATRHESGTFCVDSVYRDLDCAVARRLRNLRDITAIYAYEDGACESFREAQKCGIKRLYDLPIGYWRAGMKIQKEEAQLNPEWASTLVATLDSEEKLYRKDEELLRANQIIVASNFTQQTLRDAPKFSAPVEVFPYGAPEPDAQLALRCNRRLRVLFAGSLSQRKGISYLIDAIGRMHGHMELTLIGRPSGSCAPLEKAMRDYHCIPSLPQPLLWEEMRRHDILVLPSLFEGFGLVILEAMARGLVVITTPHTAGPDIIENGIDGWIVPIRSSDALVHAFETLDGDRNRLRDMSQAALQKARRYSWSAYQSLLVDKVCDLKEVAA